MPPSKPKSLKHPQLVWGGVAVLSLVGLIGTYMLFVEPPPPRRLVIATGSTDGAYYDFAQKYAEILKSDGFTLEVRASKGSIENLQLLRDHEVGAALVQSGLADAEMKKSLRCAGQSLSRTVVDFLSRRGENRAPQSIRRQAYRGGTTRQRHPRCRDFAP